MDNEDGKLYRFLEALFDRTGGEPSNQMSMYDIGTSLSLDRDEAKRIVEELIGAGWVAIMTLSGGISLTSDGMEKMRQQKRDRPFAEDATPTLGEDAVLDNARQEKVEKIVADLKSQAGNIGLAFDTLQELMADVKTIEAQMTSSKPKTEIVRACFRSIETIMEKAGMSDQLDVIRKLLG
jgi:hypothetical protein